MSQEKSNQLPSGWAYATIDELVGVNGIFTDGDWIESKDQSQNGGIRLVQLADLGDGFFRDRSNRFMDYEKALELNCTFLEGGDILIARMPEPLGRAVIFPYGETEKYVTVVDIAIIRPKNQDIYNNYLRHCINSPEIRKKIQELQTGTTRKRISRGNLSKIEIPIAPLAEQKKIVAVIDELFSCLDNSLVDLKTGLIKLKTLEQSLLKHAFEGKLSKKWRENNQPETGELISNKIHSIRNSNFQNEINQWKQKLKEWETTDKKSKKPNKPSKIKNLPEFTGEELSSFPTIPYEWKWSKVTLLTEYHPYAIKAGPFGSSLKKDSYVLNSPYKIYGQEQVIGDDAFLGNYFVPEAKYNELITCKIKPFDILISLVGTVGKVLILPENCQPGIINPRLIKISLDLTFYNPQLFKYYFESLFLKSLYSSQTHGATMDVLNLGIIEKLPFPLMTMQEQDFLVQELEYQFSAIDYLEKSIYKAIDQLDVLRKKILKNAFEGKLVNQESQDESADLILTRIKEEKLNYEAPVKPKQEITKKIKMDKEKALTIIEILQSSASSISAKELWQKSAHRDNIEDFYAELKKIENEIIEVKIDTEAFLSLKNENK